MKKILFALFLALFVLSACSILTTPEPTPLPTPTNTLVPSPTRTIVPSPTETPIPPTSTPEPSPTSTPDPLLFRDDFEGVLDSSWNWVREDNKYWNLTNNPGWLEIMAGYGGVGSGNIKNLLLRSVPEGNFELETRLNFQPAGNYQIAGLLIYESAANFVQFGRAFCNAQQCTRDGYYLDFVTSGNLNPENFATKITETEIVYLRLRREGEVFTAYGSEDGEEWKVIGAHTGSINPLFVGLVAGQALNSSPKPAQFDYFMINALN